MNNFDQCKYMKILENKEFATLHDVINCISAHHAVQVARGDIKLRSFESHVFVAAEIDEEIEYLHHIINEFECVRTSLDNPNTLTPEAIINSCKCYKNETRTGYETRDTLLFIQARNIYYDGCDIECGISITAYDTNNNHRNIYTNTIIIHVVHACKYLIDGLEKTIKRQLKDHNESVKIIHETHDKFMENHKRNMEVLDNLINQSDIFKNSEDSDNTEKLNAIGDILDDILKDYEDGDQKIKTSDRLINPTSSTC